MCKEGRRAPGVEAAVRRWYVGGAAVEAVLWRRLVASLACTGPGWKKKELIPAEEKEESFLG